jgi:glycerophosphoryl diester phosphodiesterase
VPPLSNEDEFSDAGLEAFSGRLDGLALATSMIFDGSNLELEHGRALVKKAHEQGLKIFVWTLRAENEFLPAAYKTLELPGTFGNWQDYFLHVWDLGIDGVFSDHPDLAVRTRP